MGAKRELIFHTRDWSLVQKRSFLNNFVQDCSSDPGSDPSSDPGSDPSSDPGSDPSSNPGSKFRYPRNQ